MKRTWRGPRLERFLITEDWNGMKYKIPLGNQEPLLGGGMCIIRVHCKCKWNVLSCVCVLVCEGAWERECVCERTSQRECMCVCMRVGVCVCVCVCILGGMLDGCLLWSNGSEQHCVRMFADPISLWDVRGNRLLPDLTSRQTLITICSIVFSVALSYLQGGQIVFNHF